MLSFMENNFATIIIAILIAVCIFLAIRKIVINKKSGIGPCGQKCSECDMNCDKRKEN